MEDPSYFPAADAALNAIFTHSRRPEEIVTRIIQHMSQGLFGAADGKSRQSFQRTPYLTRAICLGLSPSSFSPSSFSVFPLHLLLFVGVACATLQGK